MAITPMYFGRPGFLFEIPHPRGGVQATRVRPVFTFPTAAGGMRTGKTALGRRQYTLRWERLWYETFAQLESFDQGHEGPGPFALIDPGRINLLTANQSGATSVFNDTDNFTVAGSGGTIGSAVTPVSRGPRALQWNFTFASSGSLELDSPSVDWPGIPVVEDVELTFSVYHRGGGTDAVMTIVPKLAWLDEDGVSVSTTSGAGGTSGSGAYAVTSVSGTPPAGAVYVLCQVDVTDQSAGSILYLDRFQLEIGDAVTDWRPGTGVMPTEVVSFAEEWPWQAADHRDAPTLTLQEVG